MAQEVIIQLQQPGAKTFVMPSGFQTSVEIHCWGAGGGSASSGALGGGGGYATTTAIINAGDIVTLCVGGPGIRTTKGTGFGDGSFAGGAPGSYGDEDGDTGGGGSGGGATAFIIDGHAVCVAAGGGGAGGSGDDSGTGTPGNPGGIYPAHASSIYAVSCGAWGSFLNTYGVWGGGQDYTVSLNFPVTGSYTFNFSVDNYGSVLLDGTAIITRTGEFNYGSVFTTTVSVSAGVHTVRVLGYNISGPAGVAAQVVKPDTSELWNTRTLLLTSGLTNSSTGGSSANGACSGGGGGGGYLGGEAGASYGDDSGDAGAGNGGLNYGTTTIAGNGATGAGKTTVYYPSLLPSMGNAGYAGYIYIKFTKKPGLKIKNPDGSGDWVQVNNTYVKTEPNRPGGSTVNTTFSTIGTSTFKIPREITSLNVTYLTATGFTSQKIDVIPGSSIEVTVGDFGQPSTIGSFTMPAYEREVFHYIGNVDHLLDADVQIATASGRNLVTSGYNASQTAAAAAVGITYTVTYEGWHGDLYSDLTFSPPPIGEVVNKFQIVPGGGGRAGAPTVEAQPTVGNGYIMSIQMYDPGGGEGGYDSTFTLQQQGYFIISYTYPAYLSGWKDITNIYVKVDNTWRPVAQSNDIVMTNY